MNRITFVPKAKSKNSVYIFKKAVLFFPRTDDSLVQYC